MVVEKETINEIKKDVEIGRFLFLGTNGLAYLSKIKAFLMIAAERHLQTHLPSSKAGPDTW